MKNFKKHLLAILKDESAQGMAEYALLIVVVLAVAMAFKNQLLSLVSSKMSAITNDVTGFTSK